MLLKADYEFLFVGKDENSFLENYCYDLFQEHGSKSGQIFVNLEVQNNPVDAEEIGGVLFETMQKIFFEDMDAAPYDRFEVALKAVNNVLSEFKAQKVSGYIGNLNVVIAAVVGDELLITQCGDSEAYLIRKRYVSIVTEGLNDEAADENDVFNSIASGKIETGDFVLFSSTRLLRYISKTDLAQCVSKKNVNESLAELQDTISTEILGKVGLTGILFSKASEDEVKNIENEMDGAFKGVLAADQFETSAKKESLSGKFFNNLKSYKNSKPQIFQAGHGVLNRIGAFFSDVFERVFSKGFGKNKILIMLIVIIFILSVSIFIANNNRAQKAELQSLDDMLETVQNRISEAQTKSSYDKQAAKDILDQAYLDAKAVLDSQYYREKAGLFLLQIEEARDKIDNVKRIEAPEVFVDLTNKRSDVNALGFANMGDRVFVFEYNALYELVLDQIQDPLTLDDKESVIAATGFDDRKSVVFLTKSGKLLEYRDGTVSFMDTDDGEFHKGVKMADWSNRIYLLDPTNSQIWRYTYKGTMNKFSKAEPYVTGEPDLAQARDLSIDSNVYVLNDTGEIDKYYAGAKVEGFSIDNPPFNLFKDPAVIYTNEKLDDVYVLDGKDARVMVYGKDAKTGNLTYESQYLFDNVGELRDLYVDANSKLMYLLTPTKILKASL